MEDLGRMHHSSLRRQKSRGSHMFPFNFGSVLRDLWDPSPSEAPLQLFSPKCQSNHTLLVFEQLPVGHSASALPSSCCSYFLPLFLFSQRSRLCSCFLASDLLHHEVPGLSVQLPPPAVSRGLDASREEDQIKLVLLQIKEINVVIHILFSE